MLQQNTIASPPTYCYIRGHLRLKHCHARACWVFDYCILSLTAGHTPVYSGQSAFYSRPFGHLLGELINESKTWFPLQRPRGAPITRHHPAKNGFAPCRAATPPDQNFTRIWPAAFPRHNTKRTSWRRRVNLVSGNQRTLEVSLESSWKFIMAQ